MNLTLLAAINGQDLVTAVIWVIVLGVCFWLLNWLCGYVGLQEPFLKIARVIIGVVAVVLLINVLLTLAGHPIIKWK